MPYPVAVAAMAAGHGIDLAPALTASLHAATGNLVSAAQRLAASRAIEALRLDREPDRFVLDGKWDFVGRGTTIRMVKGDARCLSGADYGTTPMILLRGD